MGIALRFHIPKRFCESKTVAQSRRHQFLQRHLRGSRKVSAAGIPASIKEGCLKYLQIAFCRRVSDKKRGFYLMKLAVFKKLPDRTEHMLPDKISIPKLGIFFEASPRFHMALLYLVYGIKRHYLRRRGECFAKEANTFAINMR
jgi:hypothetical protein